MTKPFGSAAAVPVVPVADSIPCVASMPPQRRCVRCAFFKKMTGHDEISRCTTQEVLFLLGRYITGRIYVIGHGVIDHRNLSGHVSAAG